MKNELTNHLVSVSIEAENRFNTLMKQYKNSYKLLSEKNKKDYHFEWVKLMNNYKNMAGVCKNFWFFFKSIELC